MRGGRRYDQSVLEQKNNRVIQLQRLVAGVSNTVAVSDGKTLTFIMSPSPCHDTILLLHRAPRVSISNAIKLWFG